MKKYFLPLLILLTACSAINGSSLGDAPTALPGAINILAAQTAAAASTETAALIPPTLTPSLTPFPSQTSPASPSVTPTFIFRLSSPTSAPSDSCPYSAPYYVRV